MCTHRWWLARLGRSAGTDRRRPGTLPLSGREQESNYHEGSRRETPAVVGASMADPFCFLGQCMVRRVLQVGRHSDVLTKIGGEGTKNLMQCATAPVFGFGLTLDSAGRGGRPSE